MSKHYLVDLMEGLSSSVITQRKELKVTARLDQKKHIPLQGSRRKRKKRKNKKKSKKSKTGQATGGATIKVGAAEIDELSDVTNMLQGLLVSTNFPDQANDN
ncbi:uncharacterized protein PITG_01344 [Phytophthora infestans T30-4]|uniref:Uncharacterized protein n=1 Tax=Phytophthora infestans (strain T30-4) TaxID=403677 RepID=D0MVA1_PHYIT|nr:uncharacterized protein PITG_01344 [Phytophthora infestans T30-4]EEY61097.1 hypothetical protein PITG_01344 [Phytophthora infestans T30-4]|eukprot:XP_002908014.1 hypothetical protein PITG_01344 [Phytophthora infestans T30-4]